jgi:acetoin utilization deacetylase AcuC-like enzyme
MSVGWVYHDDFLRHDTGPTHPERPERLLALTLALERAGRLRPMTRVEFRAATLDDLCLIHDPAYIDLLAVACQQGLGFLGSLDTPVSKSSYEVARRAAGGVLAACDEVADGRLDRAFCAVRPPGHHAHRDRAMGFCLLNHVALAAEHLIRRRGLRRVAIVDIDVHHGNGTQAIFEDRSEVLYVSVHEHPGTLPFPGTGNADERGRGAGFGYTLNLPMTAGSGDADYRCVFARRLVPALEQFAPEMLLVSAGFDAAADDRIANINLEPDSYAWITRQLVEVAESSCSGRLVSVLEGGYDPVTLGRCVVAHVAGLWGSTSQ